MDLENQCPSEPDWNFNGLDRQYGIPDKKLNKMDHCAWAQIEASVDDDEYGLLLMNNGAACFVHWH